MTEDADRRIVAIGAALACLGVIFGAFGAHALKGQITGDALGWWQTAVQYQMWHALAVVVLGLSGRREFFLPGRLFTAGILIFSGTLYAMALGAPHLLGAITPVGGLLLIVGWAVLAWRGLRSNF